MLRIVKLTFKEEEVTNFLKSFEESKEHIRSFKGCNSMILLRDKKNSNIFFTYSDWVEEGNLEEYRDSDLFKKIWTTVKPMFQEKAQAWSVEKFA